MDWAVIFDMDGVIVDSEELHATVEAELFRELGFEISPDEHRQFVGRTAPAMWSILKERFNLEEDVGTLVHICGDRYRHAMASGRPPQLVEGARPLIQTLHQQGVEVAVASSSSREEIEQVLNAHDLAAYLSAWVGGDEVREGKPHPEIYSRGAQLLGMDPRRCVAIEDSTAGVQSSRAAGMACVGLRSKNSGSQDLSCATTVVESLLELTPDSLFKLLHSDDPGFARA